MLPPPPDDAEFTPWLSQPGRSWPPHIREQVRTWLSDEPCRSVLIGGAERLVQTSDAEDFWQSYNVERIYDDLTAFEPKLLGFLFYLPLYFRYYCRGQARKLRRGNEREGELHDEPGVGKGREAEPAGNADAELLAHFHAMNRRLTLDAVAVVLLRDVPVYSFDEIGQALGTSADAARATYERAMGRPHAGVWTGDVSLDLQRLLRIMKERPKPPLTPREVALILLRCWLESPFYEIALVMQQRESTTRVAHHRAIRRLRPCLEDEGYR